MNRILLGTGFALVLFAMPAPAQQQPAPSGGESGSMKKVDPPTNPSPPAPSTTGTSPGTTTGPAGADKVEIPGAYSRPPEAENQPKPVPDNPAIPSR